MPQNFSCIRQVGDFRQISADNGVGVFRSDERLIKVVLDEEPLRAFMAQAESCDIQSLEYVAFRRFALAQTLDAAYGGALSPLFRRLLKNRNDGALLVGFDGGGDIRGNADSLVKLGTALAHLFGVSNNDAMSGKFYARFVVAASDASDSYLRNGARRMELHNDGTFVDESTDFVLMMKIAEQHADGGDSLLLHLDDWDGLGDFAAHPLARRAMRFAAPPSKNVAATVSHPIFGEDAQGRKTMSFIDQFVQPRSVEEGLYLQALSNSLENCDKTTAVAVPPGWTLVCNNHFWLHGRDRFRPHPHLHRELMRQRGAFFN